MGADPGRAGLHFHRHGRRGRSTRARRRGPRCGWPSPSRDLAVSAEIVSATHLNRAAFPPHTPPPLLLPLPFPPSPRPRPPPRRGPPCAVRASTMEADDGPADEMSSSQIDRLSMPRCKPAARTVGLQTVVVTASPPHRHFLSAPPDPPSISFLPFQLRHAPPLCFMTRLFVSCPASLFHDPPLCFSVPYSRATPCLALCHFLPAMPCPATSPPPPINPPCPVSLPPSRVLKALFVHGDTQCNICCLRLLRRRMRNAPIDPR